MQSVNSVDGGRKRSRSLQRLLAGLVALAPLVLVTTSASAQTGISLQAGVFEPWTGQDGYEIGGSVLTRIGGEGRFRLGGEFMYREFETEYFNVSDIETQSFRLAFVAHYLLIPDGIFHPYVGGKVNIAVNVIDGDAVEAARPQLDVIDVGTGAGVAGTAGLELQLGDHFAIYTEVNASADVQLTDEDGSLDAENIGGVSGVGGVRVLF